MSYNREAIKQFIRDYSKENHDTTYNDENINIDIFFTLNEDVESMNIVDVGKQAFFNELDQYIYATCTSREHLLFIMLCEGQSLKRIADILMITKSRVYQIYSDLLDKLENKEG